MIMEKHIDTTKYETLAHMKRVQDLMNLFVYEILKRGSVHDASKLQSPELEGFHEKTAQLNAITYDGPEYRQSLKDLEQTLLHHYGHNRHHPEHFRNGVSDMTLIDLIEMFCDWKASSERQKNGNIRQSLEKNTDKFNLPPLLVKILNNTIDIFDKE
jgi:hypothetical protein